MVKSDLMTIIMVVAYQNDNLANYTLLMDKAYKIGIHNINDIVMNFVPYHRERYVKSQVC